MKLVKCIPEFQFFTVFLKKRNISFKIKRSKVTDYAALKDGLQDLAADLAIPAPIFYKISLYLFVIMMVKAC